MKKSVLIIYTAVLFALLCLPMVLLPFFRNDVSLEKRALAEFPPLASDGQLNLQFSDGFESWLRDRVPLRPQLITAANAIQGELLHSQTGNVIVGKDGWLFYASEAADFMGTGAMTDRQIRSLAVTLSLLQERVEQGGGQFTFAPVPNKSTIYGQYMPAQYTRAAQSNLTRLMELCPQYGVNCTDLASVLVSHRGEDVYHRRDSHWNYRGALLGANAILSSLGRAHPDWSGAAYTVERTWRGDLDKLLLPAGGVPDDQIFYEIDHARFRFTRPQGVTDTKAQLESFMSDREERDDLFSTKNTELDDGSRLYIARDSFARALLPYLIDCYESATFQRTASPNVSSLAEGTDVIFEIAERNLSRVIDTAPFMDAPVREGVTAAGKKTGPALTTVCESVGNSVHLYGALPGDADMGDGRVYLLLEREGERICLEAFPICEKAVAEGADPCGFSAYLPDQVNLSGAVTLTVVAGDMAYGCGQIDISSVNS